MTEYELIQEWMRFAKDDLSVAGMTLEMWPRKTQISAFHSQQCAEKALKGYLISKRIDPPKVHNLVQLCQMCIDSAPSFDTMLDICARLTKYAAASRYPDELEVDEPMAKTALDQARQVYEFCAARIPPEAGEG